MEEGIASLVSPLVSGSVFIVISDIQRIET